MARLNENEPAQNASQEPFSRSTKIGFIAGNAGIWKRQENKIIQRLLL